MKHTGFTQGPWAAYQANGISHTWKIGAMLTAGGVTGPDKLVAETDSESNARLIADAPDLLAENERLRALLEDVRHYFAACEEMRPGVDHGTEGNRIRAALKVTP